MFWRGGHGYLDRISCAGWSFQGQSSKHTPETGAFANMKKPVNNAGKGRTRSAALILVLCASTPFAFLLLGRPDLSEMEIGPWLVPKLIFDAPLAMEKFGESQARAYISYRLFSLFWGTAIAFILTGALLVMKKRGIIQTLLFRRKTVSPAPWKVIRFLWIFCAGLFVVNWVLPTDLAEPGTFRLFAVNPNCFGLALMSVPIGLFSGFLAFALALTISCWRKTND